LLITATAASAAAPPSFQKQILTGKYYCDGITAGDDNRDGKPDIVAGPFWYAGPDFKAAHEFYPAKEFPLPPSPTDSMFSYVHDFNGDGWPDILVLGRVHLHQAFWYENPKGAAGHWKKHFVFERVKGESPPFLDVNGDGKPELLTHFEDQWGLVQPNVAEATKPWTFSPITAKAKWDQFYHGTGIGDVNGDGRLDLILNDGWWEQPAAKGELWTEHRFRFAEKGGAQMFAYDVDGDGDNDIITSLDAHGWGLAWFEQKKSATGQISFEKHPIMGDFSTTNAGGVTFSELHGSSFADIDGDGIPDFVTGKRFWSHLDTFIDPDPHGPPVLYVYRTVRNPKAPSR